MGNFLLQDQHEESLGFGVGHVRIGQGMETAHTHPDVEVNFLLAGTLRYLYGGSIAEAETMSFTVLWGGIPHQALDPVTNGVWLTIPLSWFLRWSLPRKFQERLLSGEILADKPDPLDRVLVERWVDDFETGEAVRQRALLLELEARLVRLALSIDQMPSSKRAMLPPAGPSQLGQVVDYLARHYQEPLTLEDVGGVVGLHPKYLARMFKQHSRMSVLQYVTRLRVAHVERLLLTSDASVLDIAMDAGFGSLGAFYRAFSAYGPGGRPLEYRRSVQDGSGTAAGLLASGLGST